jgi:hypothetical protein
MGHSSPRAALIYQHATSERDKTVADGLGQFLRDARTPPGRHRMIWPVDGPTGRCRVSNALENISLTWWRGIHV